MSQAALYKLVSTPSMQQISGPCMMFAPRLPVRAFRRPFNNAFLDVSCTSQMHKRQGMSVRSPHSRPQHPQLRALNSNPWPCLGAMAPLLIASGPSRADEVTEAATDVAAAATKATADLPPTVTFGGSFGQYDPIIAVFFYAVVAALLVLTLGVTYLSIRNWQDSTDEKKERSMYSRSSQDRDLAEMSGKARSRRQPPRSKASKSNNKGFGS